MGVPLTRAFGALVLCAVLISAGRVAAQESRSTIAGRISDPHDAGIAGVKVVITKIDTGVVLTVTTNDKGLYAAPLLLPGKYSVMAEHAGFRRAQRNDVVLTIEDTIEVNLHLELGRLDESITVTESAPVIESGDVSMGVLFGSREFNGLPIAHGNPYSLVALAPGTTFEGDLTMNHPYDADDIANYSMSGSVGGTTELTVEGVSNTSKGASGQVAAGYVPPAAAVGEMKVQTSAFDARNGQTSGAMVSISLRSGTNKLHASGTFTKMSPGWTANDFFANRSGLPRADFDYNRWSGSLDGPVYIPGIYRGKNRTFFSWTYEGLSDERPRRGSPLTVPTLGQRKGDFSDLLAVGSSYQIYDPATRRLDTGSTTRYREDPIPGNIIPASRINPVAANVMAYFAPPQDKGTTTDHRNNYPQPNTPVSTSYWNQSERIDHNLPSGDRLFLRTSDYVRDTAQQDYFNSAATGLRTRYKPVLASIDLVHPLGSMMVLNLRYGYSRFARITEPKYGRGFDLTSLGFPQKLNDSITADLREFPVFNIEGYFTTVNTGELRHMDTHSLVAAATKIRGAHTLDFGFEYRVYRQNQYGGTSTRSGYYAFDSTWTKGPLDNANASGIGQGMAAFLLGLPSSGSYLARAADFSEESTVWSGYAQDNWRILPKVTLSLGVRYEVEGPLTERYNRTIRDFDSDAVLPIDAAARAAFTASWGANPTKELTPAQFQVKGGLVYAGINGQPRELWRRDSNNFAPRVGLAWAPSRKLVVRSGYGIFFSGMGMRRADVLQNGFSRNTSLVPTKDNGLHFYATLSNPFPDGILEPVGASQGLMTDVGNSITFFDPAPVAAYNQRWQISVQRQLGPAAMLEAAYVGNRSTKMELGRDLNIVGNQHLSRSPFYDPAVVNYLSANIANPFRGLPGVNGTIGANTTISRESLLHPFPQFAAVTAGTYQGYSWYHSLQMQATRRFHKGASLNGTYTWSKNMFANSFLNPGDDLPYRSLWSADRKHRITVAAIYEMPFGRRGSIWRGAPRPVNAVIGGWQVSSIYIYQSGVPLSWGDVVFFGNASDIKKGPQTVSQWFNINAGFTRSTTTRPASYHYRTWPMRFSDVRGPALSNVDLSLSKRWRLLERTEVQLRGEALNAFNHPLFANPVTDQFSTAFGQITSMANYPRQLQAVLRVSF